MSREHGRKGKMTRKREQKTKKLKDRKRIGENRNQIEERKKLLSLLPIEIGVSCS